MPSLSFKPKARLLFQLGDELIRNEGVALLELVKNAYDADATRVLLTMDDVDSKDRGTITVEDDGSGMDMWTITNVWMEPGSDYKADPSRTTEKFGRMPLGNKGVGRFAVHKMGDLADLTTRRAGEKEIHMTIDWNAFQNTKYLEDVPVTIEERDPVEFTGGRTGTKIVIRSLRAPWTRAMLREAYRSYTSLQSPLDSPDAFKTEFSTNKEEWLQDMASWGDVRHLALFKFACEIRGSRIEKFEYEFEPWDAMDKLSRRTKTESGEPGKNIDLKDHQNNPIDLDKVTVHVVPSKMGAERVHRRLSCLGSEFPQNHVNSYWTSTRSARYDSADTFSIWTPGCSNSDCKTTRRRTRDEASKNIWTYMEGSEFSETGYASMTTASPATTG